MGTPTSPGSASTCTTGAVLLAAALLALSGCAELNAISQRNAGPDPWSPESAGVAAAPARAVQTTPQYRNVPADGVIVERPVSQASVTTLNSTYLDYVDLTRQSRTSKVSGADRLVWTGDVDLAHSRIQRPVDRLVAPAVATQVMRHGSAASQVTVTTFPLRNGQLTPGAKAALSEFRAGPTDHFYVDFSHSTPEPDAQASKRFVAVWRDILPTLRRHGLRPANVTVGGSSYGRTEDAILLIQVEG